MLEQFGLTLNQVSSDLNRCIAFASVKIVYCESARTCVRGPEHARQFLKTDASHYTEQLRSLADPVMDNDDVRIAELPSYDAALMQVRNVSLTTFQFVVRAVQSKLPHEDKYQAFSRIELLWTLIVLHAIGFDSLRWHMKSFCLNDETVNNFQLSGNIRMRGRKPSEVRVATNVNWKERFTLEIRPRTQFSGNQKKVIALDYGKGGSKTKFPVRYTMLYYALKRLELDNDPDTRKLQDQYIVVLNKNQISQSTD